MKRKRIVPQNNTLNYNCKREEKEVGEEAENRNKGLQGPGFHSKKQEMVDGGERGKGESQCTGCRYWKTQKRTVRRAISVKHIFFRIYHHALVSPKANLIFPLCGNYRP